MPDFPSFLFVAAFAPVWILGGVVAWTRWLRRRTGTPLWACRVAFALAVGSAVAIATGMVGAFTAAVSGCHGSCLVYLNQRGRTAFVEDVAEPLEWSMLGLAAVLVLLVWLLSCTWRWHWRALSPGGRQAHPYR